MNPCFRGLLGHDRTVPSLARVPLAEVLPHDYLDAEGELRRLAGDLDNHPLAAGRSPWH